MMFRIDWRGIARKRVFGQSVGRWLERLGVRRYRRRETAVQLDFYWLMKR